MDGKVALVTGSSSGIGVTIATDLLKQGCSVIFTGSRSKAEVEQILKSAQEIGPKVDYIQCDLTTDPQSLCTKVDELYPDGVHILVNNAGITRIQPLVDTTIESWNEIISLHLTAPFILTKHFIPKMKKKGWGRVINVSSILGIVSAPGFALYSSSKHGLNGLTKAVALEYATDGVTVNAVCPTFVDTPSSDITVKCFAEINQTDVDTAREMIVSKYCPTKMAIQPSEISAMVLYLCSDGSKNVTGSLMTLDAGILAS